jgi:starch phosphorylase
LLDTDLAENAPEDREITHYLHGGDDLYRLKQEMVLGIGGVRLLEALGFEVSAYHMNEGHSALLGVELLRRFAYAAGDLRDNELRYNVPRVRAKCRFTTHTPVEAGMDRFSYSLVERAFTSEEGGVSLIDIRELKHLAGEDALNMTRLALNLSEYINGVAEKHAEVSRALFPGYRVHAITNGVHPFTWASPAFRALYDHHLPGWCLEPEILTRADALIPEMPLWQAHLEAKRALIEHVRARAGSALAPELPTIGFARRMTAYKRPDLLFTDTERLKSIASGRPFSLVLAGKAHPRDECGKQLITQLHHDIQALAAHIPIVFLPEYDMETAQLLVAGVDIWLNTPMPPMEASGTSGMKAAFNGVPSLSVLDGWWIEGCLEGVTGWAIESAENSAAAAAKALYDKLEKTVLPLFPKSSAEPGRWIDIMKGAITKNASYFNSHRMMRRYAAESYLR